MNIQRELAHQLSAVDFVMTPEQTERLKSLPRLNNISSYFSRAYMVRLYIGGRQQIIGVTKHKHVAARFADMAALYFEQIGARRAKKSGFNFDRATAESDLQHPVAAPLLGMLVSHFFPSGVPPKPAPKTPQRKSLRGELEQLRQELTEVHQQLCSVQDKLSVL